MYMYGSEILEHMKINKTRKHFAGRYYLDTIIFDIDKGKESNEGTLRRAQELVRMLSNEWLNQECIWPFFSGRGFHITTPDFFGFPQGRNDLPDIVDATLTAYFPHIDPIYDAGRLIRVAHTRNQKSGKYKIPLTLDELFGMKADDIVELAKVKRVIPVSRETPNQIHTAKIIVPKEQPKSVILTTSMQGTDGAELLTTQHRKNTDIATVVPCAQKMFAEGSSTTHRRPRILRIASAWRRQGIPEQATLAACIHQFSTLEPAEVQRVVGEVYTTNYEYSCHDEWMQRYCDSKCKFAAKKNFTLDVMDAAAMEKQFTAFVRSHWNGMKLSLNDVFTLPQPFSFYPGEYVTFMGDTGLGKTAFIQNLMVKWKVPSLLFSLETSATLMYRRFVQIEHNMTKEQVIEHYQYNDNHLSKNLQHIKIVTVKPQLSAIKELITTSGAQLIVVDVIDAIDVPYKNEMDKLKAIASELSAWSQQYDIIIFGVSHISKKAAYGGALDVHSASGPGTIEHRSDKVITIEGDLKANYRIIRSQKARDEAPFQLATVYDVNTFRFEQVTF